MTVAIVGVFCRNSLDNDRGEGIFVFKTDIIFSHNRESLEEVLTIDPDDIFLTFDGSRDTDTTCSDLCISRGYLDLSIM